MSTRWRVGGLLAALLLVEAASFFKLSAWLSWTNEAWLAYTSALAFVGLLLASIIALGSNIPESMRKQFYLGGVWLFGVQGLANLLIAYEHSFALLPVNVVTGFFGIGPELALKAMALIQGTTLSVVSIAFWSVLGQLLRSDWQERQQQRANLRQIEELLREVSQ